MRWGCLQLCKLLAGCCWVTITNVVATVGENHSWTVKSCSGRTDGVPNLGRALNQPWGAEVSADLPTEDAAAGQRAEDIPLSSSKPMLMHKTTFLWDKSFSCPERGAKGFQGSC